MSAMIEAVFRNLTGHPAPRSSIAVHVPGSAIEPVFERPDFEYQAAGIALHWPEDNTATVNSDGGFELAKHKPLSLAPVIERVGEAYYSVATGQHIVFPTGFYGLVLPVPRFFDPVPSGAFCDSPAVVPRLIAFDYWPKPLTLLCRLPQTGTQHIFYAGEPYCQIIPVPRGEVALKPMDDGDLEVWQDREAFYDKHADQLGGYDGFIRDVRRNGGWFALRTQYEIGH